MKFLLTFLCLSISAYAVTLEDVMTSLDERDAALEQKYNNIDIEYERIEWLDSEGLQGTAKNVALLNQAIAEFDKMKNEFINLNKGIEGITEITNFTDNDFSPYPMATVQNYASVLVHLAINIRKLEYLKWTPDIEENLWEYIINEDSEYPSKGEHSQFFDTTIEEEDVLLLSGVGFYNTPSLKAKESAFTHVALDYHYELPEDYTEEEQEEQERYAIFFSDGDFNYIKSIKTDDELFSETEFTLLSRTAWHALDKPLLHPKKSESSGEFMFDGEQNAYYTIEQSGKEMDYRTGFDDVPDLKIALSLDETKDGFIRSYLQEDNIRDDGWNADFQPRFRYFPGYFFDENSYSLLLRSLTTPNGYAAAGINKDFAANYYANNSFFKRDYYLICKLNSTNGVNKASYESSLQSLLLLGNSSSDGDIVIHPHKSRLFEICLGLGIDRDHFGKLGVDLFSKRFDMTYSLEFFGCNDNYHVVHQEMRSDRDQVLPLEELGIPYSIPDVDISKHQEDYTVPVRIDYGVDGTGSNDPVYAQDLHDARTLFEAWDKPRIEQVAGKNILADISYNEDHYAGYTISLYRHAIDINSLEDGVKIDTANLELIRTWTFSTDHADMLHPTTPEKLIVNGSHGETYTFRGPTPGPQIDAEYSNYDWYEVEGSHNWEFKVEQDGENGKKEIYKKSITLQIVEGEEGAEDEGEFKIERTTIVEHLDAILSSTYTSNTLDPFDDKHPEDWQIITAGTTITGTATLGDEGDPVFRYRDLPKSINIDYGDIQPSVSIEFHDSGLLKSHAQSSWRTLGTIDGEGNYTISKQYLNQ